MTAAHTTRPDAHPTPDGAHSAADLGGGTRRPRWSTIASTAARLVLGGIWVWAGLAKTTDPDAAIRATRAYQLLPEVMVKPVAWGLPFVEIALGVLLIAGLATRAAAACSALFLLAYIAAIASVWARGLQIDCGCFGGGGFSPHVHAWQYASEMLRDALLVGLATFVTLGPKTAYALESWNRR